mgnify:CR=1 FL=1
MGKYFGTDGVRGVAGADLTCELAMKIGRGAAAVLTGSTGHRPRILIGKDTRQSGDMLEAALTAGLCSVGADVESLGVLPTPAVAYLVGKYNADAGIVISASHNPMEFNGIKIFAGTGYKLPDEVENQIEAYIDNDCAGIELKTGAEVGRVYRRDDGLQDYVDHLYESIHGDLTGLNVCIDCANGASAAVAQKLFPRLGAKCTFIGIAPDGENINKGVGSTHLENLEKAVVEGGFDCGIAFDGDADRCLGCDEKGQEMDGDKIIALLAMTMILSVLTMKSIRFRALLCGRPSVVIRRGEIDQGEMRRNRLTVDELLEELRSQGYTDPQKVEYAILETNGQLSVLPRAAEKPPTLGQLGLEAQESGLPLVLISDGRLLERNLRVRGYDGHWLDKQLEQRGLKRWEEVFLMTVDEQGQIYLAPREREGRRGA